MKLPLLTLFASAFALSSAFVLPPTRAVITRSLMHPTSTTFSNQQTPLYMSTEDSSKSNLPMLLDPGTKGGALFLSLVLFVVPILVYQVIVNVFGVDGIEAGKWIGVGFTAFTTILWVSTYIFRVATKDMTYAKQLKDYENAVIAKRLEELDEDEVQALVEDIERDDF
mmetsp:Transcript_7332/g.13507  ORF Transcript_7332/g.13507 Transcript_7332/m.13507 type:complete len:168 (-) Transcript_7332:68-571(-)|eukprot:CAMPEP_0202484230 /NCGR_PEP_ID=MMETSP1361-20130828/3341_1 /ASSEMBLY_ACC=CAM_ASM_000849 /TAXON_ID=210615 /ORGANISM="Staurosira complex sp., Strain CCMP2646" /LENGTH=167 /DNA_ID=CAMNT_0049112801 /DNA_START=80 /DNA_END=583 /DNA_ORIENTATION=-